MGIGALRSSTRFGNSNRGTNNSRGYVYIHFSRENRPVLIHQLRENITSRFTSSDVVSSFSIFDPRKVPATSCPLFSLYGEGAIDTLIDHYAQDFPAETVHDVQFVKEGIISLDVCTEWKRIVNFCLSNPKTI